jgi:hypothetical protein
MIQRFLAAFSMTWFLLLPTVGCNQKEKAVLPSATIPLPEHGPVGSAPIADPVPRGTVIPKDTDAGKAKPPELDKDKGAEPAKKDAPK